MGCGVSELRSQPGLGCGLGFAPFWLTRVGDSSSGLLYPGTPVHAAPWGERCLPPDAGGCSSGSGLCGVQALWPPPATQPSPPPPSWEELTPPCSSSCTRGKTTFPGPASCWELLRNLHAPDASPDGWVCSPPLRYLSWSCERGADKGCALREERPVPALRALVNTWNPGRTGPEGASRVPGSKCPIGRGRELRPRE